MIYNKKEIQEPARRAGVDLDKLLRLSKFSFIFPIAAIAYSPLLSLILLLFTLRLPHIYLWYRAKERRMRIRRELPLYVTSLKWALTVYPVQKAICSVGYGEVSEVLKDFCIRYKQGEKFEDAIMEAAVFPELEDLAKRLILIYRTGKGGELLDLYTKQISSENLSESRRSSARMQIFAVAYTAIAAVLPAMYSGFSLYTGGTNVIYSSLLASAGLVILWKVLN